MKYSYNLSIEDIENYLNTIFDLQSKLMDKEFKISMLEFELQLERSLLTSMKRIYLPPVR